MKRLLTVVFFYVAVGVFLLSIDFGLFLYFALIFIPLPFLFWWDTGNWMFSKKTVKEKNDNVGKKFIDHM